MLKTENVDDIIDQIYLFWSMGVAIHDVRLASDLAVRILKSVKQLSIADQELRKTDIAKTLHEGLTLMKNKTRHVDLKVEIDDVRPVIANSGELVQIWINIIKNACESMGAANTPQPTLTVKATENENYAVITVVDNGPGIPDDVKNKIFQPNFTTKKGDNSFGLGLGLSVVQKFIDNYNGTIKVDSVPGETVFTIKIPLLKETVEA